MSSNLTKSKRDRFVLVTLYFLSASVGLVPGAGVFFGHGATWSEPVKTIDGVKVASVICYDQLLVWPWLEVMAGNTQLVITPRNDWWASGTGIPRIQRDTSIAFSRLIGAREITATNW